MNKSARDRAARLESILARHTAAERRTLADLRGAGFHFTNVAAAYRRLKAIKTLERMSFEQQAEVAVIAIERGPR